MSANHETTTELLGDLTRAVETVEAKQQALDDAIESRNTIIMEALREGVPAETIAGKLGVLVADVELLLSSHLLLTGRRLPPEQNGRT